MSYKITVVSASWCPSCQVLKSNLTEAKIIYHMIDADKSENMEIISSLGVRSLPAVVIYKGDEVFKILAGKSIKDQLTEVLKVYGV